MPEFELTDRNGRKNEGKESKKEQGTAPGKETRAAKAVERDDVRYQHHQAYRHEYPVAGLGRISLAS